MITLIYYVTFLLYFTIGCKDDSNPVVPEKSKIIPTRITNSPFPVSQQPDTLYLVDDSKFSESQIVSIQALQGILAQTKPRIYRLHGNSYQKWLNDLNRNYGVIVDNTFISDFSGLIRKFRSEINGYILFDRDQSIYAATSLAGIKKAIPITTEDEGVIKDLGLSLIEDVRNKDQAWLIDQYGSEFNKNIICYQPPNAVSYLSDYSTFTKSLFVYDRLNSDLTTRLFSLMSPNSVLFGWGESEYDLIEKASENSIVVLPSDWALNISTLSNFEAETKQKSHNTNPEIIEDVHTVCFLMTDGDNIQWLLGGFADNSKWYGSPNRGKIPLGWTMAPTMSEIAPTVLKDFYSKAKQNSTGKDYFVAGPSGYGYIFPDNYRQLNSYAETLNEYLAKSDMNIVNILGNSMDEQYMKPLLKQENVDALFFYYYSHYSGGEGKIKWYDGKPVITGRYNLWEGFESSESLAEKLNVSSKDIYSSRGYSLIPVHVWSNSVDDVIDCVRKLDDDVRVVAPDEFVALIKQNLNK